jgi:hypothetical protein
MSTQKTICLAVELKFFMPPTPMITYLASFVASSSSVFFRPPPDARPSMTIRE